MCLQKLECGNIDKVHEPMILNTVLYIAHDQDSKLTANCHSSGVVTQ